MSVWAIGSSARHKRRGPQKREKEREREIGEDCRCFSTQSEKWKQFFVALYLLLGRTGLWVEGVNTDARSLSLIPSLSLSIYFFSLLSFALGSHFFLCILFINLCMSLSPCHRSLLNL